MKNQRQVANLFSQLVALTVLAAIVFGLVWLKFHAFNPLDRLLP